MILMYYLGNISSGPMSWKHKEPAFSDVESIRLGAAAALGKAEMNKCISVNQITLLGGGGGEQVPN